LRCNTQLTVLDVRPRDRFAAAHVPGSLHIELAPNLATWAGWLISCDQPIVIVTDDEQQRRDAVTQFIRIGLDRIDGHLAGGIKDWTRAGLPTASLETIPPTTAASRLHTPPSPTVLDVRTDSEWRGGHIDGATHIMLGLLPARIGELSRDRAILTICGSGYRSSIASSLLKRSGFDPVASINGGMDDWRAAGLPVTSPA
jgi:hydroxyacylglutathione hydrolase